MATTNSKPPFRRALLMAGGGLRFGYYLGIYQALCDTGRTPDLVIGTCGGAMSTALLLNTLATHGGSCRQSLLNVMSSRLFYDVIGNIQGKSPQNYGQYLLPAIKRWINCQTFKRLHRFFDEPIGATKLTDKLIFNLSHHAIGQIYDETNTPYWRLSCEVAYPNAPTSALICASRLTHTTTGNKWQSTLWTSHSSLYQAIHDVSPINILAEYSPLISSDYHLNHFPLPVMVRASITDMYYLPPCHYNNELLMGGVLDLVPIELACQLAEVVYAEPKTRFDGWLAEPAIYNAFGYLPNTRLNSVLDYMTKNSQVCYLHTEDCRRIRPLIRKKPNFKQGCIQAIHADFDEFVKIGIEQFDYGYRIGLSSDEQRG